MVPRASRLQEWLDGNGIPSMRLEEVTGIARGQLRRIRQGGNLTVETMLRILRGARQLSGRKVHVLELFDLDSDDAVIPATAPQTAHE